MAVELTNRIKGGVSCRIAGGSIPGSTAEGTALVMQVEGRAHPFFASVVLNWAEKHSVIEKHCVIIIFSVIPKNTIYLDGWIVSSSFREHGLSFFPC